MARRREAGSSLELLLDTICNTFGGVVFIAILVIILMQMSGEPQTASPPDQSQQKELLAWEDRRAEAEARLKSLREAAAQQEAIFDQLVDSEDQALVAELAALQSRRGELSEERLKSLGDVSQAQIKSNEAAARLSALKSRLQEAPKRIAALESALQQEIARRTQTARLPVERETRKREIPVLLQAGRLHSFYVVHPNGATEFNDAECAKSPAGQGEKVRTRPGTGIALEDSDASREALGQRFKYLDSRTDYIGVFIWPDSFAQFRAFKDQLVERKFEYRLVPMSPDGVVVTGQPVKSKPKVQ